MAADRLVIEALPRLRDGRMVLAFSGWMDGGEVSTGTVEWLARTLSARPIGGISPEGFYIYNFPGSMEIATLFRPHTDIEDGLIKVFEPPRNLFFCHEESRLVLFRGKEPNLNWGDFADCLFSCASKAGVSELYFVGSYGGTVPHTRQPRLYSTVSDESLKPRLERCGVSFTNYRGPASFSTHLLAQAARHGFGMVSVVAEIPAYIQGSNPKCIEAVARKLAALLDLPVNPDELRVLSSAWEERLTELLEQKTELSGHIRKLEEDYDNQVFDTQMGDLKEWLEQQGIRVD